MGVKEKTVAVLDLPEDVLHISVSPSESLMKMTNDAAVRESGIRFQPH